MAYQSKYTGLQIDDILDSVEWKQGKIEDLASIRAGAQKGATALQSYTEKYTGTVTGIKINGETKSGSGIIDLGTISTDISGKQDKLVDGVNIATINGQSLTAGGDLTIEGGAKIYEWFYGGESESESVTLSQEEYDNIVGADIVVVNAGGVWSCVVNKSGKEFSEAIGEYALTGQIDMQGIKMLLNIRIIISTKVATITLEEQNILTKTSELENDSNFISSDGLKTINGESIVGSGNIEISGGGSSGGEDIRYFTEFTMEDFLNINNYDNSELISAAQNNKIICIPAFDSTKGTGYYIPHYACGIHNNDVSLEITILRQGIEYSLSYQSFNNYFTINSIPYKTEIKYLYDTELSFDSKDNILYLAQEELSSLSVYEDLILDLGSTIRFVPSEDFVLTMPENTLWANGVMPEIEPHVQYELSLTMDNNYSFLAVLTPFKSVE